MSKVSELILNEVKLAIAEKGLCSFMLTGGRTASLLYKDLFTSFKNFSDLNKIDFFFTDERSVSPSHRDSNYFMVKKHLFKGEFPKNINIFRMKADSDDMSKAAEEYTKILPSSLDVMILTIGDDGHIASLFPFSKQLREDSYKVICVESDRHPYSRLTITLPVISKAKRVFVLAIGETKSKMYKKACLKMSDFNKIPAKLVLDRDWITEIS